MRTIKERACVNHGKPRWRVVVPADCAPDGKRILRYFVSRADAKDFVAELNRSRGGAVASLVGLSAAVQEACHRAVRVLGDHAHRMDEAAAMFLRHLNQTPKEVITVGDAVNRCVTAKAQAGNRPRSIAQLKHSLGKFALIHGNAALHTVTPEMIDSYLDGTGWAQATRRSAVTDLRTLFSFGIKRGWVEKNPADQVEKPQFEDKPPEILSVSDCHSLMATCQAADPGLVPYVALCLFAGIRPAEAAKLVPEDLLPQYVQVSAAKSKTRARRLVKIAPNLSEWLALGGGEMPPSNLRKRMESVRKAAKVKWSHDVMRHSFASYHLAAHDSADKTALQMGHTSTQMLFAHYRELVTQAEAERFWAIRPTPPPALQDP
jgi:integrase